MFTVHSCHFLLKAFHGTLNSAHLLIAQKRRQNYIVPCSVYRLVFDWQADVPNTAGAPFGTRCQLAVYAHVGLRGGRQLALSLQFPDLAVVIGRQGWPAGTRAGSRTPGLTSRRRSLDEQPRRFWPSKAHQQRPGWQRTCKYIDLVSIERPSRRRLFCGPHFEYAKFANFGSYVRTVRAFRLSGSPVAVRAGASLLGRWLLPRVRQHSALSAISWRSDLRGAANTQKLRRQNFCSRWTSLVELSSGPAAQSRHHLRTVQTTTEGIPLFGKHEHGALWLLICGALEKKHLLTYSCFSNHINIRDFPIGSFLNSDVFSLNASVRPKTQQTGCLCLLAPTDFTT